MIRFDCLGIEGLEFCLVRDVDLDPDEVVCDRIHDKLFVNSLFGCFLGGVGTT